MQVINNNSNEYSIDYEDTVTLPIPSFLEDTQDNKYILQHYVKIINKSSIQEPMHYIFMLDLSGSMKKIDEVYQPFKDFTEQSFNQFNKVAGMHEVLNNYQSLNLETLKAKTINAIEFDTLKNQIGIDKNIIYNNSINTNTRISNAKELICNLIDKLNDNDSFELITFGNTAEHVEVNNNWFLVKNSKELVDNFKYKVRNLNLQNDNYFRLGFEALRLKRQTQSTTQQPLRQPQSKNTSIFFITDGGSDYNNTQDFKYQEHFVSIMQNVFGNNIPPVVPITIGYDDSFAMAKKFADRTRTILINSPCGTLTTEQFKQLERYMRPRVTLMIDKQDCGECYINVDLKQLYLVNKLNETLELKVENNSYTLPVRESRDEEKIISALLSYVRQTLSKLTLEINGFKSSVDINYGGQASEEMNTIRIGKVRGLLPHSNTFDTSITRHTVNNFSQDSDPGLTVSNRSHNAQQNQKNASEKMKKFANSLLDYVQCNILASDDSINLTAFFVESHKKIQRITNATVPEHILSEIDITFNSLNKFTDKQWFINARKILNELQNSTDKIDDKIKYFHKEVALIFTNKPDLVEKIKERKTTINVKNNIYLDKLNYLDALIQALITNNSKKEAVKAFKTETDKVIQSIQSIKSVLTKNNSDNTGYLSSEATQKNACRTIKVMFRRNEDVSLNQEQANLGSISTSNLIDQYFVSKNANEIYAELKRRNDFSSKGNTISVSCAHIMAERGEVDSINNDFINCKSNSNVVPILFAQSIDSVKKFLTVESLDLTIIDKVNTPVYIRLILNHGFKIDNFLNILPLHQKIKIFDHLQQWKPENKNIVGSVVSKKLLSALRVNLLGIEYSNELSENDFEILLKFYYANDKVKAIQFFSANKNLCNSSDTEIQNNTHLYSESLSVDAVYTFYRLVNNISKDNNKELFILLEKETFFMPKDVRINLLLPLAKELTKNSTEKYLDEKLINDINTQHQILKIVNEEVIQGEFSPNDLMATNDRNAETASKEYYSAVCERLTDPINKNLIIDTAEYYIWDNDKPGQLHAKITLPCIGNIAVKSSLEGYLNCISLMNINERNAAIKSLSTVSKYITDYNSHLKDFHAYKESLENPPEKIAAYNAVNLLFKDIDYVSINTIIEKLIEATRNSSKKGFGNEYNADPHWMMVAKLIFSKLWVEILSEEERLCFAKDIRFCNFMNIITNKGTDLVDKENLYIKYGTVENRLNIANPIPCTDIAQNSLSSFYADKSDEKCNLIKKRTVQRELITFYEIKTIDAQANSKLTELENKVSQSSENARQCLRELQKTVCSVQLVSEALDLNLDAEAERLEAAARLEAARLEAERLEAERLEAERLEAERLEAERLEAERLEAERLEAERLEAAQAELQIKKITARNNAVKYGAIYGAVSTSLSAILGSIINGQAVLSVLSVVNPILGGIILVGLALLAGAAVGAGLGLLNVIV